MLKEMEQVLIEEQYSKTNINKLIKDSIDKDSTMYELGKKLIVNYANSNYNYESKNTRVRLLKYNHEVEELLDYVWWAVLGNTIITPIQNSIGKIANKLTLNTIDSIKCAAELLAILEPMGLYTLYSYDSPEHEHKTISIKLNYVLSEDIQSKIDKCKYLDPLICKPKDWTKNNKGGYLSFNKHVVLGKSNNSNEELCLDVNNILQSIEWTLDTDVLEYEEVSTKPLDTVEKQKNYANKVKESINTYNYLLDTGNKFYFEWRIDFRGRLYSSGYHVNLQGTEYKKAMLNFNNKEKLSIKPIT